MVDDWKQDVPREAHYQERYGRSEENLVVGC